MPRIFIVCSTIALLSIDHLMAQGLGPAHNALRDGDIIFQRSRSGQSEAIALATGSPWTHVGVLFLEKGEWQVLEAVGPVRTIPLEQWIANGEGEKFVLKRLDPAHGKLDVEALSAMRRIGKKYLGRPYDELFLWDEERLYCSELVWKVYSEGAGIQLCEPATLRAFSLDHHVVKRTMQQRFGASIPWDGLVVAPSSLFNCPMLMSVSDGQ